MASPASNVASAAAAPVLQPGAQAAGAHQQVPVAPAMPGANRVDAAVTFSSVAPGDDNWTQVKIIHDIRELQHHYTQDKIWMNETVKVDDNHAAMIDRNANAIQKMHAIVIEQDRAHHTMVQALREEFATMVRLLEDDHQKKGQEMDGVKKEVMGVADIRGQMDMLRQQVVQQDLRGPHQELRGQLDAVHRQLLQQDSGHLQRLEEVKTETEKVLYQMRDEIVALQMHAKSQAAAAAAPPRAPDPRLVQAAARVEARSVGETLKSEFVEMLKALQAFLCEVDDKVAAMEIQIADNYGRQDLHADAQAIPQEYMAAAAAVQPEAAKPSFLGQFRQNHNGHEGAQHFSVATPGGGSVGGAGHGRADYFGGTPAVDPAKGYPCSGPHGGVEHRGGACQQGLPQGAHGIPHLPGVHPPVHGAHRQAGAGPQAGWGGPPQGGYGGGGGGGYGGGGGFGIQPHNINLYTKLFDEKAAKELNQYNGITGGAMWRKKITAYLVSRAPDLRTLLPWAEKQTDVISDYSANVFGAANGCEVPPWILSRHVWGFLNVNLKDEAWEIFDNCPGGNGLEVWRRVLLDVAQKTQAERMRLEDSVLNPPKCKDESRIFISIERWEAAYKVYIEAGGEHMTEEKKIGAVLRMLPEVIRDKALWEYDNFDTVRKLQEWIRKKVKNVYSWHSPGKSPANVLEDDGIGDDERQEILNIIGEEATEEQILAVFKAKQARFQTRRRGGPPLGGNRSSPPPRDRKDLTCPNCLKKGHPAWECPEERTDPSQRKCFICFKKGHEARNCPDKETLRKKPAKALEAEPVKHMMRMDPDGFTPVQRRRQKAQLGDFVVAREANEGKLCLPKQRKKKKTTAMPGLGAPDSQHCAWPALRAPESQHAHGTSAAAPRNSFEALTAEEPEKQPNPFGPLHAKFRGAQPVDQEKLFHELEAKAAAIEEMLTPKKSFKGLEFEKGASSAEILQRIKEAAEEGRVDLHPDDILEVLNLLEVEQQELDVAEEDEALWTIIELALDSGAGDHVASACDAPAYQVEESPGSKIKQHFLAAGGAKLANQGQITLDMMFPIEDGEAEVESTFQVAEVSRPLFSVSKVCDAGYDVVFNAKRAKIVNSKGVVVGVFERQGGLYVAKIRVRNPKAKPSEGFGRRG